MVEIKNPLQSIYFNKRDSTTKYDVDWLDWTLKLSKNEINSLTFKLLYPDEWIDKNTNTGLLLDIGDEINLYGTYGGKEIDSHKFGGVISNIEGSYGDETTVSIEAMDWRYLLKNKIVFKNYKTLPLNVSKYANLTGKIPSYTNLYDLVAHVCGYVGITDLSGLQNPYLFKIDGSQNIESTKSGGANSQCRTTEGIVGAGTSDINCIGVPSPGYKFIFGSGDTEVKWTLYNDATGFDISEYPNLAFNYHYPNNQISEFGFKLTINGAAYYLPWTSSLREYGAVNYLSGIAPSYTDTYSSINVPIGQLLMETFPDTKYTLTKIEFVAKRAAGLLPGYVYMDNIGMIKGTLSIPQLDDYTYLDCLTLINNYCNKTNNWFEITPAKIPKIHNLQYRLTDKYIIEGLNLISAKVKFDDDNLVNNLFVMSKLEETKALFAQSVNPNSYLKHGYYEKVDEQSDYKERSEIRKFAKNKVATQSEITPSVTCSVLPSFDYYEGQVIYVHIPSLGIERSLEILSVTYTNTGSVNVELGNPDLLFNELLKDLNTNQKIGLTRGVNGFDETLKTKVSGRFSTIYQAPKGRMYMTGIDLIESNIDLNNDMDGLVPKWISSQLQGKITIDGSGITINWTPNTKNTLCNRQSTFERYTNEVVPIANMWVKSGATYFGADLGIGYNGQFGLNFQVANVNTNYAYASKSYHEGACSPGDVVSGGFKVKCPTARGTVTASITWLKSDYSVISSSDGATITPTTSYQLVKVENKTAPANTAYYCITFRMDGCTIGDYYHFDEVQQNIGSTLNPYEEGGNVVYLPVGLIFNNERFGAISDVMIDYTQASTTGLVHAKDIYYTEFDPSAWGTNRLFIVDLEALTLTTGNYTYTSGAGTLDGIVPPTRYLSNLLRIVNEYTGSGAIGGTTKITKKEIRYTTIVNNR